MATPAHSRRYSTVAILLHWLIAAAIVLQVVLAGRMEPPYTPMTFAVTQLHKSIGITILLLSLARLAWRLVNPPPPMPADMAGWEKTLARVTHVGFYVIMIGMPLTGWLMVSTSRIVLPTLLFGVVHWPDLPLVGGLEPAAKHLWNQIGQNGHGLLAKLIYVLLALHVAGALKHQLFSKDEPVLARMAPGAVAGRWLEPRLLIILLSFVGVIAFGKLFQPALPHTAPTAAPVAVEAPEPAAPAPVATAAPPTTETAPAAPSDDPAHWKVAAGSALTFATTWGGDPVQGRFDRWKADILFGPKALDRSKVVVTIDMASAKTGDEQRDASLPSTDWFDSAANPSAVFTATRFSAAGEGKFVAHGTLKLRGVSKPLDLPFDLKIDGARATMSGRASLDRLAFGVGQGEFTATDQIPAKVAVRVQLRATRADPPGQ